MNKTLVKGMALLEVLARSSEALGVSELARRVDIGKSNTHRLLQTLTELGYVRRDVRTGTYEASIRLWELGTSVFENLNLPALALPTMQKLLLWYEETVHLSVLDGYDVVYMEKLDSPNPVRAYTQVGGRAPAHCVATGKALLAQMSDTALQLLSKNIKAHTPHTITDPERFMDEVKHIRKQGYAVNAGEWRENVYGIAAVIRDPRGKPLVALGVSAPSVRIPPERWPEIGQGVMQAAAELQQVLWDSAQTTTEMRNLKESEDARSS